MIWNTSWGSSLRFILSFNFRRKILKDILILISFSFKDRFCFFLWQDGALIPHNDLIAPAGFGFRLDFNSENIDKIIDQQKSTKFQILKTGFNKSIKRTQWNKKKPDICWVQLFISQTFYYFFFILHFASHFSIALHILFI
jgi:hypothetical protein